MYKIALWVYCECVNSYIFIVDADPLSKSGQGTWDDRVRDICRNDTKRLVRRVNERGRR